MSWTHHNRSGVNEEAGEARLRHKERQQMENTVKTRLQSLQFGEAQTYKSIAIIPIITPADGTFQYLTLGESERMASYGARRFHAYE